MTHVDYDVEGRQLPTRLNYHGMQLSAQLDELCPPLPSYDEVVKENRRDAPQEASSATNDDRLPTYEESTQQGTSRIVTEAEQ